ncbi:MAG TPA: hypothetical protein VMZ71_07955, partial [Gemmataceae bacterium]|nr:hypothetical protein [Gemmataceae bacterium]
RRVGHSGPPGLRLATLRTVVFHLLLGGMLVGGPVANELFPHSPAGRAVGAVVVAGSFIALLLQFRKRRGYRGLHDLASGCQVTQRPRRARKLRLHSTHPSPLDATLPTVAALPELVGGYALRGRLWEDSQSQQVWAAEDRALGRKVLLWLRPGGSFPILSAPPEVSRPSRLRQLGHGRLTWAGRGYDWTAFSAPVGAPLADTINPARPLPWADARFLLEQVADELRAADADGSMPKTVSLNQVWVEPNGRVQVLEFPVPYAPPDHDGSLGLVRRVASLALEGKPRTTSEGVRAPLPTHAVPLLNRLFDPKGHPTLTDFTENLAETHAHAPEVTPSMRAAHIGLQAAGVAPGLGLMLLIAGILSVALAFGTGERAKQAEAVAAALKDPDERVELGKIKDAERSLKNTPAALARLTDLTVRLRDESARRRAALPAPQRYALEQFERAMKDEESVTRVGPLTQRELLAWAGAAEKSSLGKARSPWNDANVAIWIVAVIPLVWVVTAALFRGGPTMALAGIAVVRADGRQAFRRQCALRAAVVWLPVAVLLSASVSVQVYAFEQPWAYLVPLLLVLVLLPVYVAVALREPSRPPQDRIAGTYLVPA